MRKLLTLKLPLKKSFILCQDKRMKWGKQQNNAVYEVSTGHEATSHSTGQCFAFPDDAALRPS